MSVIEAAMIVVDFEVRTGHLRSQWRLDFSVTIAIQIARRPERLCSRIQQTRGKNYTCTNRKTRTWTIHFAPLSLFSYSFNLGSQRTTMPPLFSCLRTCRSEEERPRIAL